VRRLVHKGDELITRQECRKLFLGDPLSLQTAQQRRGHQYDPDSQPRQTLSISRSNGLPMATSFSLNQTRTPRDWSRSCSSFAAPCRSSHAMPDLKRGSALSSGKLERGDVAGAEVLVDAGRSNPFSESVDHIFTATARHLQKSCQWWLRAPETSFRSGRASGEAVVGQLSPTRKGHSASPELLPANRNAGWRRTG
jgi:hypothetical protein